MWALNDVQVENLSPVEDRQINRFARLTPEDIKNRATDFADRGLVRAARTEMDEAWAEEIGSRAVANEISGPFEMS
jgi:hypothetical protein